MSKQYGIFKSFNTRDPLITYACEHSIRQTEAQKKLNEATLKHPENVMLGAPEVLQLNSNIMRAIGAKKVLDVGVYTGASALSSALALPPNGEVHALDVTDKYLQIGYPFWEEDKVVDKIKVHIGPAKDTLQRFIDQGQEGTFDYAFVDADKPNMCTYFELCLKLIRSGGVIAFDNTLWSGYVLNENDQSQNTVSIREFNNKIKDDDRINISLLNIGDGLTLCFKK